MKTSDFYYDLPEELIAQTPLEKRDNSRLLVLDRQTGQIEHRHFYDIGDYLEEGDLLVVNNSRVLPARLYGFKEETGSHMEFLLLEQKENNRWEVLVKPGKKAKPGARFIFGDGLLRVQPQAAQTGHLHCGEVGVRLFSQLRVHAGHKGRRQRRAHSLSTSQSGFMMGSKAKNRGLSASGKDSFKCARPAIMLTGRSSCAAAC